MEKHRFFVDTIDVFVPVMVDYPIYRTNFKQDFDWTYR